MAEQPATIKAPDDGDAPARPSAEAGCDGQGSYALPSGDSDAAARPVYRVFGREFRKPGSRNARIALGVALCAGGVFGFLPVLGFWMIPLGLLILSHEFHLLRRVRRRWAVRAGRQRAARATKNQDSTPNQP